MQVLLDVMGQKTLLANNPTLARLIQMRNPYVDPINILQVSMGGQGGQGGVWKCV